MNFGNIGPLELLMILVIVLVIFGAKRVPEIGASIGKGIKEFKRGLKDREVEPPEPPPSVNPPAALPPAGSAPKRLTR